MGAWLLILTLALCAPAQDPVPAPEQPKVEEPKPQQPEVEEPAPEDADRRSKLERWEAMSEEERSQARERFEALSKLTW